MPHYGAHGWPTGHLAVPSGWPAAIGVRELCGFSGCNRTATRSGRFGHVSFLLPQLAGVARISQSCPHHGERQHLWVAELCGEPDHGQVGDSLGARIRRSPLTVADSSLAYGLDRRPRGPPDSRRVSSANFPDSCTRFTTPHPLCFAHLGGGGQARHSTYPRDDGGSNVVGRRYPEGTSFVILRGEAR